LTYNLDIATPKSVTNTIELQPVVYSSVENKLSIQLYLPPNHKYLRKDDTSTIKLMNCTHLTNWQTKSTPVCLTDDADSDCETALTANQISDIISTCEFQYINPDPVVSLTGNGLLVQGLTTTAYEDNKPITKGLPIVMYSNKPVLVRIAGKTDITFPAIEEVVPKILTTKLSKIDLLALSTRALWSVFWRDFDLNDYLEYINLALNLLFIPLSFISFCMTCACCKCCKRKKKHSSIERRSRRSIMSKEEKKELQERNKRLLSRANR
jgi:hypothetical protein